MKPRISKSLVDEKNRKLRWLERLFTDFIIADEPTGNLDSESTFQMADILIKANQIGNTIVLVTHDEALLQYLKLNVQLRMIQL